MQLVARGSMFAHGLLIWKYSTQNLKINHLSNTPSTKAAGGVIFSGVFTQRRQGTTQGQENFELSWYLFFQHIFLGFGPIPTKILHANVCVTLGKGLQDAMSVSRSFLTKN